MPKLLRIGSLLLLALAGQIVAGAEPAGEVVDLTGAASTRSSDGLIRDLARGDPVFSGDAIRTAPDSKVGLRFSDGTRFYLGPGATMIVGDYRYQRKSRTDSFTARVLRGSFRFLTGRIAKTRPSAMEVRLTVAAIGVRGTQVAGEVEETSALVVLLEPEAQEPSAIVVSNEFGSVTIDEPGFGTEIPDAQSPPSPPRRMRLQTINRVLGSVRTIRRLTVPRPPRMR